jgi:DNA-binding NarL/FixJ family response regulator
MQNIFLTQAGVTSPRWLHAFPRAKIINSTENLPLNFTGVLLWVLLGDAQLLQKIPAWIAAGARVVVLTQIENAPEAKHVIELGANGYLHYLAAEQVLTQASQVVQLGGLWLGADLLRQLVLATHQTLSQQIFFPQTFSSQILSPQTRPVKINAPQLNALTLREKSVAKAVASGKTNKEVARELEITERTVKAHLSAVFEKLNLRDRLQLVLVMAGK